MGNDPVAWVAFATDGSESAAVYITQEEARAAADEWNWCIAPLYRSPTLTDAEREAIEWALDEGVWSYGDPEDWTKAERLRAFLRGLLERTR